MQKDVEGLHVFANKGLQRIKLAELQMTATSKRTEGAMVPPPTDTDEPHTLIQKPSNL
ncbi:hypothetical protein FF011L_33870 [Roseimaritima multifibrata]|uniref:Uncharacterized protein n=1 Tax=Roseimaritima multifibrata TaxID=1930274 RepID=A0A517MI93_9BACT|nr:hypothetical protein [Roseimaritima multifibrata]QDS94608.1 hypothetical protein FF011L_33870 [Roseimaritima multifibrata]